MEQFGTVSMAAAGNRSLHYAEDFNGSGTSLPQLQRFVIDRHAEVHQQEGFAFVGHLRGAGPSPITVHDGRAPVMLAEAAAGSLRLGNPVSVDGG